jgi:hypothetical protein
MSGQSEAAVNGKAQRQGAVPKRILVVETTS